MDHYAFSPWRLCHCPPVRCRPGLGGIEEIQDHSGLGLGIRDPVVRPDLRGLLLDPGIGIPGAGVPAQIVTEQQVLALPIGSGLADVYVHVPRLACEGAKEAVQVHKPAPPEQKK